MRALSFGFVFLLFLFVSARAGAEAAEPLERREVACAPLCEPPQPPQPPQPPPVRTHMRSIPLFVTGVVFDVAGGAATAAGVGLLATAGSCRDERNDSGCGVAGALVGLAGVAALVGGAVLLAIGIPLTVVGATSVPDAKAARSTPGVHLGGSGLAVTF
jgi:hypothetical protein